MDGSYHHDKYFQSKLLDVIDANLNNTNFGVSELAREMGMSRSNLHLKVKKVSNSSVSQLINHVRLKKAFELLNNNELTVSEKETIMKQLHGLLSSTRF